MTKDRSSKRGRLQDYLEILSGLMRGGLSRHDQPRDYNQGDGASSASSLVRASRVSAFTFVVLLLGIGCKGTSSTCAEHEMNIKLGVAAPLSGPQAHLGKDIENGARLAAEEVSVSGLLIGGKKIKVELVLEDDQADPKTATIVAQRLVDGAVMGVIGHMNSGASIPASKIYFDSGIPQISPSSTAVKYTTQGFHTALRVMTNDAQQGKALGTYAVGLGKRIAIIDDQTAYGQGLANEVESAVLASGGEVVGHEYTTDRSTDFSAILTSLKGRAPDVIFFGGMDPQGAAMVKQMRQLGLTSTLVGGDGLQTPKFIELAGDNASGTIASIPGAPLAAMPDGARFQNSFEAKFGKIQLYAPYAYDSVKIIVDAMKRADSTNPTDYLPRLFETNYEGVTGHIGFDSKGDLTSGVVTIYKVVNGKWEVVETVKRD